MSARLASLLTLALVLTPACKGEEAPAQDKPADKSADKAADNAADAGGAAVASAGADSAATAQPAGEAGAGEAGAGEGTDTGDEQPEPAAPLPDSFEKVGVAACDDYVAAYEACIGEKVPEGEREAQRRLVFENVKAWKQTAAGGAAAEKGLQTACKIATEQAKRATQDWGCAW